ncbi:MAG: polysulfide reductase, NrfD [Gammaproteobacteria bacterium]|nr:polysulfide reductase, NrfD [Gammaproteobacteria bacterium]
MENFSFWSVVITDFLFVLYLALGGVTLSAVLHLVNGQWRFQVRKLACSLAILFPIAFVLLLIILASGEASFPWIAQLQHGGESGEHHMSGWHNQTFLIARQVIGFLVVAGLYLLFIKLQHQSEVDSSYAAQRRFRNVALMIPFFYFTYGTMVAWDFEMTQMAGWHSASYGAYHFQSNFHMFLGFFTIFLFFLARSRNLTKPFEGYIFNFMAQFMLAMTILWTYLYFTQYLIMWYGRLPDETTRYFHMMTEGLAPLWWIFLTLKFIIPFCTLAITPNRHNPAVIVMVAFSIVIGTWIERYTWISGSVDPQYYRLPMTSIMDIVVTAAVFAACWFAVRYSLIRYGLIKTSA